MIGFEHSCRAAWRWSAITGMTLHKADAAQPKGTVFINVHKQREDDKARVSDLLCMSNLSHASILKEHDNNDDFQGRSRRTA